MPAAAIAAAVALSLGACTQPQPVPTPTHSVTSTPIFTSDEQALKAATAAYAAYLKVSDTISHDGGADPERIKPYVTSAQLSRELNGFLALSKNHRHTTGETSFDRVALVRRDLAGNEIDLFLCIDIGATRLLNDQGQEIQVENRRSRVPMQVQFTGDRGRLLVSRSDVWSGKNFC